MRYRFGDYQLDVAARELRAGEAGVPLQPQVFDLLVYLIERRDRVVAKDELDRALWPETAVGDTSLQRAVSLARAALPALPGAIRTFPRRGYRFAADVTALAPADADVPRPRYTAVRSAEGDIHIAYQVIGDGGPDSDVVVVPGWTWPMSAWRGPAAAALAALSAGARVILFDRRGVGLSDRVKRPAGLDERVDDLRAVLDAAGARRPVVLGVSEGSPLAIRFAVRHPDRVRGLVLVGGFARWTATADHPHGWRPDQVDALRAYIETAWGTGRTILAMVPAHAADPALTAWAGAVERDGSSPGAALDMVAMNLDLDVRADLPRVTTPTIVLHHDADRVAAVGSGRHLASAIPGARLVVVPGDDHAFLLDDTACLVDAVRALAR